MDRHGEIIDGICLMAGIKERRKPCATSLSKKEALQIRSYMQTQKKMLAAYVKRRTDNG